MTIPAANTLLVFALACKPPEKVEDTDDTTPPPGSVYVPTGTDAPGSETGGSVTDSGATDSGATDTDTVIPPDAACDNGLDDDLDGWFDLADPGCTDAADGDEGGFDLTHTCNDGVDNDLDSLIDALDPDCGSATDVEPLASPISPAGILMLPIAGGTFDMGCTAEQLATGLCDPYNEFPVHTVTLTRAIWVAQTEVTVSQYQAVTGVNPALHGTCLDCPVESVSWYDVVAFANVLSASEGLDACYDCSPGPCTPAEDLYGCTGYRLPTEAEWEYVARCGESWVYPGGDDPDLVAWTGQNSGGQTQPVATKEPNACGLYDLGGNVHEWISDSFTESYDVGPVTDPFSPSGGYNRSTRGGHWSYDPYRTSQRDAAGPGFQYSILGFRLVRTIP